jgi:glutaminyl-tRNA synthetase
MSETEATVKEFLTKLGWDLEKSAQRVADVLKNKKLSNTLIYLSKELSGADGEKLKAVGPTVFDIAGRYPYDGTTTYIGQVARWAVEGKVKVPQLDAITDLVKKTKNPSIETLEKECGVGETVSEEVIKSTVAALFASKAEELKEQRYAMINVLHAELRVSLKWADKALVAKELNDKLLEVLGPKTEEDNKKKPASKPKKTAAPEAASSSASSSSPAPTGLGSTNARIQESIKFPKPEENEQLDPKLLEAHLASTGGMVVTRFPPEPNGFLHIGHAKAMNLNFGYAKKMGGKCYLRFDDTNPEAETKEYIDSIIDTVRWLGNEPVEITYASDQFDKLYDLAVELIKRGKAYVCHQKPEEYRGSLTSEKRRSPWRDRSVEENLKLFADMRDGKYKEGEATLRMKMDLESSNPCMWDLVAYRVKYHAHPHVGDKWCIYPSYDFTHCLNDSIENISHSLCTLEYVLRRESYNWLVDALSMYRPLVWEYGRLNLTHTVLSKRLLIKLVQEHKVRGWDDPRMPTIAAYRRRGYTPESINNFCEDIGVTRADGVFTPIERLEAALRADLDGKAVRYMAVTRPLKITITSLKEPLACERQNIPGKPELGTNTVTLYPTVWIERSDFKEGDIDKYNGLAFETKSGKAKWVRLKYGTIITITKVIKDANGDILELEAIHDEKKEITKPSGTIHWVSAAPGETPIVAQFRLYNNLFLHEKPVSLKAEERWANINPESLVELEGYIDPTASSLKVWDHMQFERLGYFNVDPDTTPENGFVFNRSVGLAEAKDKPK